MNDTSSSTDGMINYEKNSLPQRHSIESRAQQVRDMADSVKATAQAINIADYGCGTGQNAVLAVRPSVESFVARYPDLYIYVYHVDQTDNDWNTLFRYAHDSDGYAGLSEYVRPVASVGTFYARAAPADSVDVGTCFGASHWLRQQPDIASPGTIWFADLQGESRATLRKQAQDDWTEFLTLRLQELRSGGRLMVSTLGAIPDQNEINGICASGRKTYRAINEVAKSMVDDGLLASEALERFVMPVWFMTKEEATEPFKYHKTLSSGFSIESVSVNEAPSNSKDIFAESRSDIQSYAAKYRGFVRSFTESTFRAALFFQPGMDAEETETMINTFYDRFEAKIAWGAGKYAFELWLMTLQLRKN